MTFVILKRKRPARALTRALSVAMLGVGLTAAARGTALASHRDSTAQKPLRGLITAVGNNALQLQTASGTVNVSFAKGATHVVRSVMGSTADVTTGKHVDLHVVKGTRTVDAIHIDQARTAPTHLVAHMPPKTGDRVAPHRDANSVAPPPMSGQVVSLNGGTLTLRYGNGSTGAFTLGPNVHVNEALTGSLADLGVGETVQIFLGTSGSTARSIIITNA